MIASNGGAPSNAVPKWYADVANVRIMFTASLRPAR